MSNLRQVCILTTKFCKKKYARVMCIVVIYYAVTCEQLNENLRVTSWRLIRGKKKK